MIKDPIKNYAKKLVEPRPDLITLQKLVRIRKPLAMHFADDGIVPNNPRLPVLVYRGSISLMHTKATDAAIIIDTLFELNGWGRSWRDTIYDFVHYHSQTHEVMGVARGDAEIEFGGIKGRILKFKAGDVAILPAGTGHRLINSCRYFLVVGAYPEGGRYDECTDTRDKDKAVKRIAKVRKPAKDPIYGAGGPFAVL